MRIYVIVIIILTSVLVELQSQNIGLGTLNPAPSAKVDIVSSNSGLLIPRMSSSQRANISAPANGLLVYDFSTASFWYYRINIWIELGKLSLIQDADNDTKVMVEKNTDEDRVRIDLASYEKLIMRLNPNLDAILEIKNPSGNVFIGDASGHMSQAGSNTGVGYQSLSSNTTGVQNTALGKESLFSNINGDGNTAIGIGSMTTNNSGDGNTAIGFYSLGNQTTGNDNVAVGQNALYGNNRDKIVAIGARALRNNSLTATNALQAIENTAVGTEALFENRTGSYNTSLGFNALKNNLGGNRNTAVGSNSMKSQISGYNNTAVGYLSMQNNKSGISNVVIGDQAMRDDTSGFYNTVIGNGALMFGSANQQIVAIGIGALSQNRNGATAGFEGTRNTAIGASALQENTIGYTNTALGWYSLTRNISGDFNVALGSSAMEFNETGNNNIVVGVSALENNINGHRNVSIGVNALQNYTESDNLAIGNSALIENHIGGGNVSIGNYSLSTGTGKINNVAIGMNAGRFSSGIGNIYLGYEAGKNATGNNKLYIHNSEDTSPLLFGQFDTRKLQINGKIGGGVDPTDALHISASGSDNPFRIQVGSQTIMRIFNNGSISLGSNNTGVSDGNVYIHNRLGVGQSVPIHPIHVGFIGGDGNGAHVTAGGTWTNGSSRAFKENFKTINHPDLLTKVASLNILLWNYKGSNEGYHLGPIAEEFYEKFGLGNDEKYISTVDADGVSLAAIQALIIENDTLKTELAHIKEILSNLILQVADLKK